MQYEIHKRAAIIEQQGRITPGSGEVLATAAFVTVATYIHQVSADAYSVYEAEARRRIPRDPDDWPTIAVALARDAAIWTLDNDFLGCGVPTWTTETLLAHL